MSLIVVCLALTSTTPASAREAERVELGVKPVGVEGSYFELTLSPGETRQLTVAFGNYGTRDAVAMTYPANVYSLVNGGMGVRLAGDPTSGTTRWLSFEIETIQLEAGEAALHAFAVSVPDGTAPGEYITSVVIQDATPAEEATAGGVVANRVNRQAIAVAVTVPGPIAPGLTLGDVEHHVSGGRSVITVEVANSGNVRLQPGGELIVTAASGGETARFPVRMESVYAGASTVAEIPFTTLLEPGEYTAVLSLADASHAVTATTPELALSVPASSMPTSASVSSIAQVATMIQPTMSQEDRSTVPLAAIAVGVMALALASFIMTIRLRPRSATPRVAAPATSLAPAPITLPARPVTIRQLDVPRRPKVSSMSEQAQPQKPRFRTLTASRAGTRVATTTVNSTVKGA